MTYNPTAEENTSYTDLADGDGLAVASVRVWLEGLSDGAKFVLLGGSFAGAAWFAGGAQTNGVGRAAWHETDQAWAAVGVGGNDFFEVSFDGGITWTDLSGSLGSSKVCVDVAPLGDELVIICSDRTVYKSARTAYATFGAFTATANALTATVSGGTIDQETTTGRVIACYRNGAAGHKVDTSTNGTAFTNRTVPAAWSGYTGTNNPEVGCGGSYAVAVFADNVGGTTHDVQAMVSADGGTTWTNVTITSGLNAADFAAGVTVTRPTYDAERAEWYFAISKNDGTLAEVYKSIDAGATWSLAFRFTAKDIALRSLELVGRALVGVTTKGRIVRSKDSGASWRISAGLNGTTGVQRLRSNGGGALVLNTTDKTARYSLRFASDLGKAV